MVCLSWFCFLSSIVYSVAKVRASKWLHEHMGAWAKEEGENLPSKKSAVLQSRNFSQYPTVYRYSY